jgi:hypothetical protein
VRLVVAALFLLVSAGLQVAAVLVVAECPRAGGRPVVVAERRLAGLPAERAAAAAVAGRPRVAAPLGPCFVSRAAPGPRRRRRAAKVLRGLREGLPTRVPD